MSLVQMMDQQIKENFESCNREKETNYNVADVVVEDISDLGGADQSALRAADQSRSDFRMHEMSDNKLKDASILEKSYRSKLTTSYAPRMEEDKSSQGGYFRNNS